VVRAIKKITEFDAKITTLKQMDKSIDKLIPK
jgi:hypothetical protein